MFYANQNAAFSVRDVFYVSRKKKKRSIPRAAFRAFPFG